MNAKKNYERLMKNGMGHLPFPVQLALQAAKIRNGATAFDIYENMSENDKKALNEELSRDLTE